MVIVRNNFLKIVIGFSDATFRKICKITSTIGIGIDKVSINETEKKNKK